MPSGHSRHCRRDGSEYVPAAHVEQPEAALVAPAATPFVPAGQYEHTSRPTSGPTVPLAHLSQLVAPVAPWNQPLGQLPQLAVPVPSVYLPAPQSVHWSTPVAPALVRSLPFGQP